MIDLLVPEMIPIKEAAARTGLSYDRIRKLCLTKQIVYFRSGAKYLINFGKLCEFLNQTEEERNAKQRFEV